MIPRELPTQTPPEGDAPEDGRIATAIDRVLDAERVAQSAIAECESQGLESLEQARQQRRAIVERAQQRIIALHTRAARALEQRVAQVRVTPGRPVGGNTAQDIDRSRLQVASERLADRLIGIGEEEI